MFRQGLLVVSGIAVVLITALLIAGYLYARKGKAELEAIQSEIRAAGGKHTFEGLGLAPGEISTEGFESFSKETDKLNNILKSINEDQGKLKLRTDLVGEDQHIQKISPHQAGFKEGISWTDVQKAHERLRIQWRICREIMHSRKMDYQPAYETGASAKIPHVKALLNWAKASNQLALLEVQKGENNQALNYLTEITEAEDKIKGDRTYTLIEGLVDVTIQGVQLGTLRQILESPGLDSPTLTKLQAQIANPNGLQSYIQSIEGERVIFGGWIWDLVRESKGDLAGTIATLAGVNTNSSPGRVVIAVMYRSLYMNYDHSYYLKSMWRMESSARRVLSGEENYRDQKTETDALLRKIENSDVIWERFQYFISSLSLPSLDLAMGKMLFCESSQRQLIIAIELKKYYLKNGSYPENLDSIALPSQLDLRDPMTLEPMFYQRLNNNSYRLYGVGLNGIDDGGNLVPYGKNDSGVRIKDDNAPDWIWPKVLTH
jgi:hypothetical protein